MDQLTTNPDQYRALGLDFGTESVRALVVDCSTGQEIAEGIVRYPHGVVVERLPGATRDLPPEFALQHAQDYIDASKEAIRRVLAVVPATTIIGVGVDFTACTILPIRKDGTPLMFLPEFKNNPHAWVKLWKHHAAQPEAVELTHIAEQRREGFLQYYSGAISSEWMLPKCWEVLRHAPEVYKATDLFIDAGDWFVQQMTGAFSRNSCMAGYKGLWNEEMGFPSQDFLKALDPGLADLREKWLQNIVAPGTEIGGISAQFAAETGLIAGTPVSAATIDAHSGVAGMGVFREGPLSIIMGTSSCHLALSRQLHLFSGYAGVVKDGVVPGFYGYESGQAAVGDIFGWFTQRFFPNERNAFDSLSFAAAKLLPGESGLIALDWWNGNRSVLMNADLSGIILGLTLDTKPHEIYRALIEATAFGTRAIIEAHVQNGIPVNELVVCGGLTKDPLIMQIYADITQLPVKVAASGQAVALGSAIFGALAAGTRRGGFADIESAICKMTRPPSAVFEPRGEAKVVYDRLFDHYLRLHDFFGREHANLMREIKTFKATAKQHRESTLSPQHSTQRLSPSSDQLSSQFSSQCSSQFSNGGIQ